jgi:hypothetical protein
VTSYASDYTGRETPAVLLNVYKTEFAYATRTVRYGTVRFRVPEYQLRSIWYRKKDDSARAAPLNRERQKLTTDRIPLALL